MTHLEKLKSVLGGANPDAVIISSGINQRYISGFPFTDGYLLVTRGKSYLVTDFRYEEAARAGADPGLEVSAPQHGMLDFIAERIFADECRSVAFEEEALRTQLMKNSGCPAGRRAGAVASTSSVPARNQGR